MNKQTQTLLLVGGAALLYYFYKNGTLGVNPANQETSSELLASTNATVAGQLNAMNTALGV